MTDIIPISTHPPSASDDINSLVDRFIAEQDIKPRSREGYKKAVHQYLLWVSKKGFQLSNITRVEIIQYKEEMIAEGKSLLTVGAYLSSVRRFYEWAEGHKLYPNVARGIKGPKSLPSFKKEGLTPEQASQLLDHFGQGNKRDYAMINLMLRTGLRTIEVVRLLVGDIIFRAGKRVLMVHGKGHDEKDAFVLLTDKAYMPIKDYLATRPGVKDADPVFIAEDGPTHALHTRSISRIAKDGLVAIGLDGKQFTAHSLRHSAAVNLLRGGATLEAVQGVLRHVSSNTTAIYTASIKDEMRILNQTEAILDEMF